MTSIKSKHPLQQILLFEKGDAPSLANFYSLGNEVLMTALHDFSSNAPSTRQLLIHGQRGSGKTHLLQAVQAHFQQTGKKTFALNPKQHIANWPDSSDLENIALWLVDDCDQLSALQLERWFAFYEQLSGQGVQFLFATSLPPPALTLPPEVNSRLLWGVVYPVHVLTDTQKHVVLDQLAQSRGFKLDTTLARYLLNHHARDLNHLIQTLIALDEYALAQKCSVTLPLYRKWQQR